MRKASVRTCLMLTLISLSTIAILQNSVKVQGEPNIYVSTESPTGSSSFIFYTNTTSLGFKFNATLWATGFVDPAVFAWQVTLYYNNTILNATGAWLPAVSDADYIFFGHASARPKPFFGYGSDYVKIGDTSLDTSVTSATPKKLGIIEFEIMATPPPGSGSNLISILNITNVDTYILDDSLSEIPTTKTNGLYELDFVQTPSQISIDAIPAMQELGGTIKISGTISTVPANASKVFQDQTVKLFHRVGTSGGFDVLTQVSTNSTSGYSYDWSTTGAKSLHQLQASWDGNDTYLSAISSIFNVTITGPLTQISLSATPTTLDYGGVVKLSGVISTIPFNASQIFSNITVTIKHRLGTSDTFTPLINVSTTSTSEYSYNWSTRGKAAGLHQFQASWSGNDTYGGAISGIVNVTVIALPTTISISATPATLDYGGAVTISGVISTVPANASEKFGFVKVNIFHRYGTSGNFTIMTSPYTNSTSGYSYIWQSAFYIAGQHQFQASWNGNASYTGANSTIVTVTVVIPAGSPTITVNNPQTGNGNFVFYTNTTTVGSRFNVTVTITNGTNVADWQVAISYNSTYLNATAVTIPSTDAQYIFYGVSTSPKVTVLPGIVKMGDFTVPIQGLNFTTAKLLVIVEFQVMATPPPGVGNKLNSLFDISNPTETFIQDPNLVNIPAFGANGLYELRSLPASTITISASPTSVNAGAVVTINGNVTTAANAPVTIWQRINSTGAFTNLTTVTTNAASIYSYSWSSSIAGTHQFKANWTGNSQYLGAESTIVDVIVTGKTNTTITLTTSPTTVAVDENVTISGRITPAVSNVNVTISATITSETPIVITARTNATGFYTVVWKPTASGNYTLRASWLGDSTYNGAQSTAVAYVVSAATGGPNYIYYILAAIVAIVIILIIAYLYTRRRRQRREEEEDEQR